MSISNTSTTVSTGDEGAVAPTRDELVAAALQYIERGWPVFPLRPGAKQPLTDHGHRDATVDPAQVERWWTAWPAANIGIATGEAGLLVLDADTYKGDLDLGEWLDGREWPETLTIRTGRGGLQYVFAQPPIPLPSTTAALHPSIDTRGTGGYVVAPPSITTDRYTVVVEPAALTAPVPEWLIDDLTKPKPKSIRRPAPVAGGWVTPYGSKVLDEECYDLARTATGRNAKLNRIAFRLGQLVAAGHLDIDTVTDRLNAAARQASANGDHLLSDREIERTLTSGLDAGMSTPALVPSTPPPTPANVPVAPVGERLVCRPLEAYTDPSPGFLWANRLTVGGVTILAGDGGIGKSFLALNLAVCFANGSGLPEQGPQDHGSSVLISFEDPGEVIRERALKMGYDPDATGHTIEVIYGPQAFSDNDDVARAMTPRDVDALIDVLRSRSDLKLVVIDPLMSFIGADVDPNRDQQVRAVLHRLLAVATELGVAVVIVAHTVKGSPDPTRALDSIAGSVGIKNLARSAHIVMRDSADSRNYIFHRKHNWTRPASALEYDFANGHFTWVGTAPESKLEQICRRSSATPVDRCVAWLTSLLREGTAGATYVFQKGEDEGFSINTIRTAQSHLRVVINKKGFQGTSYWSLPDDLA